MEEMNVKRISFRRPLVIAGFFAVILLCFLLCSVKAGAKTIKIKTPEQLVKINYASEGFGPGNTYVIDNDMTISDTQEGTCRMTKGKFVIDFNGHTVQSAIENQTVFTVNGGEVVMKDSKVSGNKASVQSYGAGAVQVLGGKLTINNGNYYGLSNGQNNPCALYTSNNSTCVVNGGNFYGQTIGVTCAGESKLYINNGNFKTDYMFALEAADSGSIKILRGNFYGGQTTYGYSFALGAMVIRDYYDFDKWLVNGCSYSQDFTTAYWNMQQQVSTQPFYASYFAVAYDTPSISVVPGSGVMPKATTISSLKPSGKTMQVGWNKQTARTGGYQVQYSTSPKFASGNKVINVSGNTKTSAKTAALKANTMYYFRVRTYRNINGGKLYSSWSAAKAYNSSVPKLTAAASANAGVKVTWAKTAGAAKYRVLRKTGSGKWVAMGDTAKTTFTDKKVSSGKKYTYTVRGLAKNGKTYTSGWSAAGKTVTYIAAPAAPALKNTKSGVQVSWKKSAGAAKYRVFRKVGNGRWTKIADSTSLKYVDKTAKNGKTYSYTIRCISKNGKAYTSAYNTSGKTIKCKR